MADKELVDFHLIAQPKGWKPGGEGKSSKMEATILAVIDGPDATRKAVGRERNISVWKTTQKGEAVPAFATMRDEATDGLRPLELKGYAELTTNDQGAPVVYLTAQKARVHDGPLPTGAGSTTGNQGAGGFSGSPMTPEDRARIIACWAFDQALDAADLAAKMGGVVYQAETPAEVKEAFRADVKGWADWFAQQAVRLGTKVTLRMDTWEAEAKATLEANQTSPQPQGQGAAADGDTRTPDSSWGVPAPETLKDPTTEDPSVSGGGTPDVDPERQRRADEGDW